VTDSRVALAADVVDDRRTRALEMLGQLLRTMDVPATLDARDLPDGSLSISVQPEVELPGVPLGRRSPLGDALQYLLNRLVNRPGAERRWIAVGLGGHPEPRAPKPPRAPVPPAPLLNGDGAAPGRTSAPPRSAPAARPPAEADERTLPAEADPVLDAAARDLAERCASSGRVYAVVALSPAERGRLLRAADVVPGVNGHAEGEGRLRRLVLTPERVVPMPRQRLPVDDGPDGD
jgi:predicted RNA-binding protein Jag